ncbi:16S rRNA (cytosine(1402)-N(4))-methyltransferase RsmH [Agromyces aerolatus]|uniref:16S rRNA (cytosine(1402)-N(4))-methyltransferase RsmH n=1 Tax=Agromyces sp. LY-1074 TaxID=3074080 RepID=UPI002856D7D7|nr:MULTISPECIES: 16S rRNA (cytosine(1402)-N(4))-methyltransferase RsmH [unclassified Agromyces]MDR5700776.1 16S rRNA (cytosine(1402)-N(4))-methyltransferase RsmH [Agromyces sp. LY-1074]MDR5707297.1 16S rRNA (cytosine(1402)-N(4))-methyltransferase RsmH [Agromyces sp. LY-1358]
MDIERIHTPVMLERTVELLAPAIGEEGAVLVDATLGMGGHSRALLERFPKLTVIGLDRDTDALAIAAERLKPFGSRARLVHTVYDGIGEAVRGEGFGEVQGVLFDLGVSSLQLDRAERGFAYAKDAPLDMRMDATRGRTAAEVIAESDESELRRIFFDYGEEKLAPRYARAIVRARAERPITRSSELVEILDDATPAAVKRAGHPAKRVFQALRIEVNEELSVLERAVPAALDVLAIGGRTVVLAYQSLEDRIVKRALQAASSSTAPAGLPMELPEHRPQFRLLVRGAELASETEQAENPRAKPVRLRAAERVRSRS